MTFGLTPEGFKAKRLSDIVEDQEEAFIAEFGNINTAPQSVFGQIIGVESKGDADLWENLNDVYLSQYPNSASGISLDNVVGLNGITRIQAAQTKVFASCYGNPGTFIPANSLAKIPNSNDYFFALNGGSIANSSVDTVAVSVDSLLAQVYTVQINSVPYIFSRPKLTFTGSFVTGNSTIVTINGVSHAAVPFNTSSAQTISDIATEIATDSAVASAMVTGSIIRIFPNIGFSVTVNFVTITGGASQPTVANEFSPPATLADVSLYLSAVINAGTPTWIATDLVGSFTIEANNPQVPFSVAVGTSLTIGAISSPILFVSQAYGPVACPLGALTEIVTPIGGWTAVNNRQAGILGNNLETDTELRIRRANSIHLLGLATVEAITAHMIGVPNVDPSSVTVFENTSMTEEDLVITFSDVISTGQTINISYNGGVGTITVPFNTDQNTTMTDLANAFLALTQVDTAVLSGINNTTLTISLNPFTEIVLVTGGVLVSGSGTLPTAVVNGGRPAKSIEVVLLGGTDQDVALEIWKTKPAGIETFGNQQVTIVDSQGNNQVIFFSRPDQVFIWVGISLTLYPEETFPDNGVQLVANSIFAYGDSLGVGMDVLIQRVQAQVFNVPGIASAVIQIAATITEDSSPSFSNVDIPISDTQISNFLLERIAVVVV